MESAPEYETWEHTAQRIVIQVSDYLDFDGRPWPGGRQRHVLDLALVVKHQWNRDVVVVQKARRGFEATCSNGIQVIGVRCPLSSLGDSVLAYHVRRLLQPNDRVVYAAGEEGWPLFAPHSKAVQHGIWWDGPLSIPKRVIQRQRVMTLCRSVQSLLCVDTNFINWLRGQWPDGLQLSRKCAYVPNYADTSRLPAAPGKSIGTPVRVLFARRFEEKRGIRLFLDGLSLFRRSGASFIADICTIGGMKEITRMLEERRLADVATVTEATLANVLERYAYADVSVVPTLWSEGTSLSCVESICAGVPVIATPVGGLGNVVIPEFNGLIVPPLPEAISEALVRITKRDTWLKLRQNCLTMRDALSRERWCRSVLDWLRS